MTLINVAKNGDAWQIRVWWMWPSDFTGMEHCYEIIKVDVREKAEEA